MKNCMKRGLLLSLIAAQSLVFADNNRTFFMPRPHLSNMPLTHGTFFSAANQDNPGFGGGFQVTPFFAQSTKKSELGNYLSFTKNNSIAIKGAAANALNQSDASADALPGNFALHEGYDGKISFNPQRTSYGVHLNYQHELSFLYDNLYMVFAAPVVTVEHSAGLTEQVAANPGSYGFKDVMAGGRLTSDFSESVKSGKISSLHRVTGLADVEIGVGYRFLNADRYRVHGEVNVTVPTGQAPTGQQIFEAFVGSNAWALGAGLGGRMCVWQAEDNEDNRFSVWANADVKYLFQNTQVRTLGLKNNPGAQFARMRQQNPADAANVLANSLPGVNAMTRAVNVTPGVLVEGMLWGDYTWNAFKVGVGYNIFGRQAERVTLREKFSPAGTYGLTGRLVQATGGPADGANYLAAVRGELPGGVVLNNPGGAGAVITLVTDQFNFPTQISAGLAAGVAGGGAGELQGAVDSGSTIKENRTTGAAGASNGVFIAESDLDLQPVSSAVSHALVAQVSYALNTDNPSYVGIGGGYECASSNSLASGFNLWCKFGITF